MAHIHEIKDAETHFIVDATTREISNAGELPALVQNDHNSERFTFVVPRTVDGHDMSICNKTRVHYLNIDSATKKQYADVYEVDDLHVDETDETKVVCTWLISRYATQHAGSLNFIVEYACEKDGVVDYAWNTAIFKGITVKNGINNAEQVLTEYTDILEKWKQSVLEELKQSGTGSGSGSGLTEEQLADFEANTEARHTHTNGKVLDRFSIDDFGTRPQFMGYPLAFEDEVQENSEARHTHENSKVLDRFSIDSLTARPAFSGFPLAYEDELTVPLETQDDIEKAVNSPNELKSAPWAVNAAGLKNYHDTFVAPLSGGNGEADHMHTNKEVLDYFGINYAGTRPTFKGNSNGLTNVLATLDDLNTKVGYLRQDLEEQISLIPKFSITVVDELPISDISYSTIYLVKDSEESGNLYTEYIYLSGKWEKLGTQSFDVDLNNYYTKQEIDEKGFITADQLPEGGGGVVPSVSEIVNAVLEELQAAEGGLY